MARVSGSPTLLAGEDLISSEASDTITIKYEAPQEISYGLSEAASDTAATPTSQRSFISVGPRTSSETHAVHNETPHPSTGARANTDGVGAHGQGRRTSHCPYLPSWMSPSMDYNRGYLPDILQNVSSSAAPYPVCAWDPRQNFRHPLGFDLAAMREISHSPEMDLVLNNSTGLVEAFPVIHVYQNVHIPPKLNVVLGDLHDHIGLCSANGEATPFPLHSTIDKFAAPNNIPFAIMMSGLRHRNWQTRIQINQFIVFTGDTTDEAVLAQNVNTHTSRWKREVCQCLIDFLRQHKWEPVLVSEFLEQHPHLREQFNGHIVGTIREMPDVCLVCTTLSRKPEKNPRQIGSPRVWALPYSTFPNVHIGDVGAPGNGGWGPNPFVAPPAVWQNYTQFNGDFYGMYGSNTASI